VSDNQYVCAECFGNQGLKDFCSAHAEVLECDFCGAADEEPIAAPIEEVIGHIESCIYRYFDDSANAGLPYETREGGWQGKTYDTYDVLEDLGLDLPQDDGDLFDGIANGIENTLWSDADPYALSPAEQLSLSWKQFCEVIKHKRRYFFLREEKTSEDEYYPHDELFSPAKTLEMIFAFAEETEAFITIPAGSKFFRARYQAAGEAWTTAAKLGPPPVELAFQTNRMSPPGVVMTYVAEDRETALAETANGPGNFAVGEFANDRDVLILDLTRFPKPPCVFAELSDTMEFDPRPRLNFLRNVSSDISRPIARDDRVHVEYVPTQVVTEYVRAAVRIGGRGVDGIRYTSSRRRATTAMVLFADQANLVLEETERPEFYRSDDRWLHLQTSDSVVVSTQDIEKWTK
jgi:hypothetical protein